jgi:hypothetical protein
VRLGRFDSPSTVAIGSSSASEFGCQRPVVRSGKVGVPTCTATVMWNAGEPNSTSRVSRWRGTRGSSQPDSAEPEADRRARSRAGSGAPLRAALAGRARVCRVKSSWRGRREVQVSDVRHLPIPEEVAAVPR